MLVEAGAVLNVCDRTNRTPLQWAIDYRQREIADYLRSKGAVEAHEGIGYVAPVLEGTIQEWIEKRFGRTKSPRWQPIVPEGPTVPIRRLEQGECRGFFTVGMSDRPMTIPEGRTGNRYVELFLPIGVGPDMADMRKQENVWVLEWMQRLARDPFENGTWFEDPVTIVANEDPPRSLGPGTDMTCWILLAHKAPLIAASLADGRHVVFCTMLPIHTDERDFEKAHGAKALLERFAAQNVPEYFVFQRKSVV